MIRNLITSALPMMVTGACAFLLIPWVITGEVCGHEHIVAIRVIEYLGVLAAFTICTSRYVNAIKEILTRRR